VLPSVASVVASVAPSRAASGHAPSLGAGGASGAPASAGNEGASGDASVSATGEKGACPSLGADWDPEPQATLTATTEGSAADKTRICERIVIALARPPSWLDDQCARSSTTLSGNRRMALYPDILVTKPLGSSLRDRSCRRRNVIEGGAVVVPVRNHDVLHRLPDVDVKLA
jgi:hypothetical protein